MPFKMEVDHAWRQLRRVPRVEGQGAGGQRIRGRVQRLPPLHPGTRSGPRGRLRDSGRPHAEVRLRLAGAARLPAGGLAGEGAGEAEVALLRVFALASIFIALTLGTGSIAGIAARVRESRVGRGGSARRGVEIPPHVWLP